MLVLLPEDEEWGVFNIIISAPYPWNGGHASMRVTTVLFEMIITHRKG